MTLKELLEAVSKLKGWKSTAEQGVAGLDVPQAGNRRQFVSLVEFKDDSHPMVRCTTRIGPAGQLEPSRLRSALELNSRLPHGCLAVDGAHLVMTVTRPLGTTTPQTTGDAVEFIARQADQYEKLIFKTDVH
ncbi:MAG TPA: hypothetical protein VE981_20780 [Planctomycetota bacterium]|nr:hypothetical protein [Planctomycetota bacterium]